MWLALEALLLVVQLPYMVSARAQEGAAPVPGVRSEASETLWKEIETAIREGRNGEAESKLRQYRILEPEDPEGILELGRVLSWTDKLDESIDTFTMYLDEYRYDMDIVVERARVRTWKGDLVLAEKEVREVLAREPEHLEGNLLLAAILQWTGRMGPAAEIYRFVLKLDPTNETAQSGEQDVRRATSARAEADFTYSADTSDYLLLKSELGVRYYVTPEATVMPYVSGAMMSSNALATLWGAGGGLDGWYEPDPDWRIGAGADVLYYFNEGGYADFGGELSVEWGPLRWLAAALGFETHLYGEQGQSQAALREGVRYYEAAASLYMSPGDWRISTGIGERFLVLDGYENSAFSASFSPLWKAWGEDLRLYVGTRHWYTSYAQTATGGLYWSPAHHLSNLGVVRFEGVVDNVEFYVDAGAGIGFERKQADSPVGPEWTTFFAAGPLAGAVVRWTPDLETGLEGYASFSSREGRYYALWSTVLDLEYRW